MPASRERPWLHTQRAEWGADVEGVDKEGVVVEGADVEGADAEVS